MIQIDIIEVGDTYPVDYKKLKLIGKQSDIFKILNKIELPNPNITKSDNNYTLMDTDFGFLEDRETTANFSVAIVNRPLEGNFFSRRINDKLLVVSIFQIETLNIHEGINLEMYLSRFIYGFITIFLSNNNSLPTTTDLIDPNRNASGCLLDFCLYKSQVAMFFRNPQISPEALTILRRKPLPENFVNSLNKEIQNLKIGLYFRLMDWLKVNPIKSILLTFFVGLIFSELLGNYIYESIHDYLPFIKNISQSTK